MTTFIFDFDGTLANSLGAIVSAFNKEAKDNDSEQIDLKDLSSFYHLTLSQIIRKLKIPTLKLPLLLHKIRGHLSKEFNSSPPFPNINTVLKMLKQEGHMLGILTSNSVKNVRAYIKYYDMQPFDFIYSERTLFRKAQTLKKLLRRQNIDPKNAIYIGDETRDIEAAQQCGIRSAAVTWGLHSETLLRKFFPDFIINSPEKLLEIK